jgi:hypothetical protein
MRQILSERVRRELSSSLNFHAVKSLISWGWHLAEASLCFQSMFTAEKTFAEHGPLATSSLLRYAYMSALFGTCLDNFGGIL